VFPEDKIEEYLQTRTDVAKHHIQFLGPLNLIQGNPD
jgi:hypothetical protein